LESLRQPKRGGEKDGKAEESEAGEDDAFSLGRPATLPAVPESHMLMAR